MAIHFEPNKNQVRYRTPGISIFDKDARPTIDGDRDRDMLTDDWENKAIQELTPILEHDENEKLFKNPDHKVVMFTRTSPITNKNGDQYIIFQHSVAYTKDYGTEWGIGDHNGDRSSFQTAWRVIDPYTIELTRLWTVGHTGKLRKNKRHKVDPDGMTFTPEGILKIYIEENKHGNWAKGFSGKGHEFKNFFRFKRHKPYDTVWNAEGSEGIIRPSNYNVGEPHAPLIDEIVSPKVHEKDAFPGEYIWNDPDGWFCGDPSRCDTPKRLKGIRGHSPEYIGGSLDNETLQKVADQLPNTSPAIRHKRDLFGELFGGTLGKLFRKKSLHGSSDSDELYGLDGDDKIYGLGGSDWLYGGRGNDELYAGLGDDILHGESGNDFLKGHQGDDNLHGGSGNDELEGNSGNDYLKGNAGHDDMRGGSGQDALYGDSGRDILKGETGDDHLYGGISNDKLYGGSGKDILKGGSGDDRLSGNSGNDRLQGNTGKDRLYGGDGQDTLYGDSGIFGFFGVGDDDYLSGGNGHDKLYGNQGDDTLVGGSGNDKLYGSRGDDNLYGDNRFSLLAKGGNDYLTGGSGADRLYGGKGKDTLKGGSGDDYLNGGASADRLDGGTGSDTLRGGSGNDRYSVDSFTDTVLESKDGGIDTISASIDYVLGEHVENLKLVDSATQGSGNSLNNRLDGNDLDNTLHGKEGDDYLDGSLGNDALYGGVGKDTLFGYVGKDRLYGGDGKDFLDGGYFYHVSQYLPLFTQYTTFLAHGIVTKLPVKPDQENRWLEGGAGNDQMYDGFGSDHLIGGAGNDVIRALGGGNDVIIGGLGDDTLAGGSGADTFIFYSLNEGTDTVTDFDRSQGDTLKLLLEGFSASDLKSGLLDETQFVLGTQATDTSDRFIYDPSTGVLLFDADGSGSKAATQLVQFSDKPALAAGDIVLFSADEDQTSKSASEATPLPAMIQGTVNSEILLGDDGSDDIIFAAAGDDNVAGGLGSDQLFGGDGADILRGDRDTSDPQVQLAGGDDVIRGGAGNDLIGGKSGNDTLIGDEGDDQIWGDNGDDILSGGLGNDILTGDDFSGGHGSDIFVLASGQGTDTVVDFEIGIDSIALVEDLKFGQISITQNGQDSHLKLGNETLAVLQRTDADALTASSFIEAFSAV